MSSVTALLYTTIGGVLGAGLNQYVTHMRDRRATRASVIKVLHDVEITLSRLRWPEDRAMSTSKIQKRFIYLEQLLATLESACLIAGIPRAAAAVYSNSCRHYEGFYRSRLNAAEGIKAVENLIERMESLREDPEYDYSIGIENVLERGSDLTAKATDLIAKVTAAEKDADGLHESTLELLGRVIWHPFLFLPYRGMFSRLEEKTNKSERLRRQYVSASREARGWIAEIERAWDRASRVINNDQPDDREGSPVTLPPSS
jgi:hypothetical protein